MHGLGQCERVLNVSDFDPVVIDDARHQPIHTKLDIPPNEEELIGAN